MSKDAEEPVSVDGFLEFFNEFPQIFNKPQYKMSLEQRKAMFAQLDVNGCGAVSKDDFLNIFRERMICAGSISLTDAFDVATSKSLEKVEPGDVIEVVGEAHTHETQGMSRAEVRLERTNTKGW